MLILALISSHSRSASAPLPESCTLPCASCSGPWPAGGDGRAALVVDAFGTAIHAAAVALVGGLHVGEELLEHEGALGQVDQVRAVVGNFLPSAEAAVRKPACRPITTRGRRRAAPRCRGWRRRRPGPRSAPLGKPGVWSLPTRSLSMVLGMWICAAGSRQPASSLTMRTVSDEVVAADVEEVARSRGRSTGRSPGSTWSGLSRVGQRRGRRVGHLLEVVAGFLVRSTESSSTMPRAPLARAVDPSHLAEAPRFERPPTSDWLITAVGPPPGRRDLSGFLQGLRQRRDLRRRRRTWQTIEQRASSGSRSVPS